MADPTVTPAPDATADPIAALSDLVKKEEAAASDYGTQRAKLQAQADAQTAPAQQGVLDASKSLSEAASADADPKNNPAPLPPNLAKHLDPKVLSDTASAFMAVGALFGLAMRQPLTAALENMTAAMKGVQEGDADQYDKAMAEYKTNVDAAEKQAKSQLARRKEILDDKNLDLTAKLNQLKIIEAAAGGPLRGLDSSFKTTMDVFKAQETAINNFLSKKQALETSTERLQMERERLGMEHDRMMMAQQHFQELHGDTNGANGGQASDMESLIEGIAAGRINPNVVSIRNNQRAKVMEEVARRYPDYDMKNFVSKQAAEIAFTRGREAQAVRAFGVSDSHLKTLSELSDALQNGDIKLFNRVGNAVAAQTGQPAPTNFDAAKRIVADEIVKAVTGAAGALGDRETADTSLARANSPAQLKGVIETYRKLIGGQIAGLERQYKAGTGKNDFKQRFQIDGGGESSHSGPTAKDREIAKRSPELAAKFKAHFGVDP